MIARPEVRSSVGVPSAIRAPEAAPTGRPVMGDAPKGVNRLTGLPFGYQPGDSTAGMDPQTTQRANDSQTRQSVNAAGAPPPLATVVQPPRPTALQQSQINRPRTVTGGVEGRAADEMRRQAEINRNPGKVNPPGLVLGKRKPLDQLVSR
jgi:hypothetical protein